MNRTPFEKLILRDAKYLDRLGVDYFLNGSTLLAAHREGRAIEWDKETNFGMLAEDKTAGLIEQLRKDYGWLEQQSGSTYTFFGKKWEGKHETVWEMEPGFSLISSFSLHNDTRYQDCGNGQALIFPSFHLDDKKKWGEIEFLGRTFKTPYMPKKWLAFYYGSDWTQPKKEWMWHLDARNLISYKNKEDLNSVQWDLNYTFSNIKDE